MIGIILTGHGNFATGLYSSVELIAGAKENFYCCDFVEGASSEDLQVKLSETINQLKERCQGIIIFSDLKGGSPFQKAVIVAHGQDNIEVIAGSNLPMILEIAVAREFIDDLGQLTEMAINTGKDQIYRYEEIKRQVTNESEDGI